jgi:hypothetical protein
MLGGEGGAGVPACYSAEKIGLVGGCWVRSGVVGWVLGEEVWVLT